MTLKNEQYKADLDNLIALARDRTIVADDYGYALAQECRAMDRLILQIETNEDKRLALLQTLSRLQPMTGSGFALREAPPPVRNQISPQPAQHGPRELHSAVPTNGRVAS